VKALLWTLAVVGWLTLAIPLHNIDPSARSPLFWLAVVGWVCIETALLNLAVWRLWP
jgi:hypothetical protein